MSFLQDNFTALAQQVFQDQYQNGFQANYRAFMERPLIDRMLAAGADSTRIGSRLTWNIREVIRASGGYISNYDLSTLSGGPDVTETIAAVYDEIYWRQVVPGPELRGIETGRSEGVKFFNTITQIFDDMEKGFWHTFVANFLRDGDGTLATVTGGDTGTVAVGATIDLEVDEVNAFIPGMTYGKYAANGTTQEATNLKVTAISTNLGAGTITFENIGSATTGALTNTGFIKLANSAAQSKGMGLGFIVDDGSEHAQYPDPATSAGFKVITRSAYQSFRSIVFDGDDGGNATPFSWSILDDLYQKLEEVGDVETVGAPENNNDPYISFPYDLLYTTAHRMALQAESRALGRQFTLGTSVEDQSLREQRYGNMRFTVSKLLPPNRLYAINARDMLLDISNPIPLGGNASSGFMHMSGTDVFELAVVNPWQVLGKKLRNQAKLKNYSGRAIGS